MKKLITLLAIGSPILLLGCNNTGGGNSSVLTAANLDEIHGNMIYFNTDTIEPIGAGTSVATLFKESDHQTNDAWDGIISLDHFDGKKVAIINILSGRTGSVNTAKWLTSYDFILNDISNHKSENSNINFSLLPDNYNFAIRGNFMFKYKPNNTEYVCNNIAIAQFHPMVFKNDWAFFSNLAPKFKAVIRNDQPLNLDLESETELTDDKVNTSTIIECFNKTSKAVEQFKVSIAYTNMFTVTKVDSKVGLLTDAELKDEVVASFNSMPLNTRLSMYSSTFDFKKYNLRNLVVMPAAASNNLQLNDDGQDVSIMLDGEPVINELDAIPVKSDIVINCANTAKEIHTTSFDNTLSSTITTSTNNTLGGTLAKLLPNDYGKFQLNIKGQNIVTAGFKYTQNSMVNVSKLQFSVPSIPIIVAPKSKRTVTATVSQFHYLGKYKFVKSVTGSLILDGYMFDADFKYLPAWITNNDSGSANIFKTFKNSTISFNPQIQLDPVSQRVLLVGGGSYEGDIAGGKFAYIINKDIPLTANEIQSYCGNEEVAIEKE